MKIFIISSLICVSLAARLENTYLPPNGAGGAGGGSGLVPPRVLGNGRGGGGGGRPGGGGGGGAGGGGEPLIGIISYENVNNGDGSYKFSYETENGIKAEEEGQLKNAGSDNEIQSVIGSYSYTAPDGQVITIEYTADENGFVPKGDHLPTPPPIPVEILKSLEANAAEEAAGGDGGDRNGGGGGGGGGGFGGGNGFPSGRPPGNGGGGANGYRY